MASGKKRIRTDIAALSMGRFTSKHPEISDKLKLKVIIRGDKARVGYELMHPAGLEESKQILALLDKAGFVQLTSDECGDSAPASTEEKLVKAPKAEKAHKAEKAPKAEKSEGISKSAQLNAEILARKQAAAAEGKPMFRAGSKRAALFDLLRSAEGVTIDGAINATGWKQSFMASVLYETASITGFKLVRNKETNAYQLV